MSASSYIHLYLGEGALDVHSEGIWAGLKVRLDEVMKGEQIFNNSEEGKYGRPLHTQPLRPSFPLLI
jgi:hypothetical protein